MADTNKVKFGLSKCYYAVATIAADGSATYSTPVALPGAVSLSLAAEGESSPFYADNIVYFTAVANNGYSGDLELAKVPDSFLTDVLGYVADANGVLVENAGASAVHFALLFQFEGDAHARRHVMYNCTSARPDVASNTTNESIEPVTETLAITATTVWNDDIDMDVVKASVTPTESTQYEAWFSSVYQSAGL